MSDSLPLAALPPAASSATTTQYDPSATGSQITAYLNDLEASPAPSRRAILHKKPVSFKDGVVRLNWESAMPDARERDIFSAFFNNSSLSTTVKIAILAGPASNWVSQSTADWDSMPWHCQAVAWIKDPTRGNRPHLVIFDPSPEHANSQMESSLVVKKLAGTFLRWVRALKPRRDPIVWYSTSQAFNEEDKCLAGCMARIQEWLKVGEQPYQGDADPRMESCVCLRFR